MYTDHKFRFGGKAQSMHCCFMTSPSTPLRCSLHWKYSEQSTPSPSAFTPLPCCLHWKVLWTIHSLSFSYHQVLCADRYWLFRFLFVRLCQLASVLVPCQDWESLLNHTCVARFTSSIHRCQGSEGVIVCLRALPRRFCCIRGQLFCWWTVSLDKYLYLTAAYTWIDCSG